MAVPIPFIWAEGMTIPNCAIFQPAHPTASTQAARREIICQEKMRGECYVRLLVHPDAASAKKAGRRSGCSTARSARLAQFHLPETLDIWLSLDAVVARASPD